jgi:small subunit ribosomal protein S4e
MKLHQKRQTVPKTWSIPRKGTTFVVKAKSGGIPLLILLRDVLGIARNRREVKKAIHEKSIFISNKLAKDERTGLELNDTLTIIPSKKNYRLILSPFGKYDLEEISEKESKMKISKISGKKILKNKKKQINLIDGKNYFCDLEFNVEDSALIDLEKNIVSKILPVKEKAKMVIIGGKHAGEKGMISKIIPELKMVEMEEEGNKTRVLIKQLMVIQ